VLITVGGEEEKRRVVPIAKAFDAMGFRIYATEHTAETLKAAGIDQVATLHKVKETRLSPNILDYLQEQKIDLVINVPLTDKQQNYPELLADGYIIRRQAVEFNVPTVTNLELASALVEVLQQRDKNSESIRSLNEYMDALPWKLW
jgi:carbamoyl-phosphate synthase large subunit